MAKAEWGTKRFCPNCGARFYDMKRSPIVCPVCETEQAGTQAPNQKKAETAKASKSARAPDRNVQAKEATPVDDVDEDAPVDNVDKDEPKDDDGGDKAKDEPIEDASELGVDDDDMVGVKNNLEEVPEEPA